MSVGNSTAERNQTTLAVDAGRHAPFERLLHGGQVLVLLTGVKSCRTQRFFAL
jgi:hypothetical protein